jgi:BirA family transcriptional regulator, biotin operon repressor / biotin---[acetyl-CoA-carboxylase] ligase
MSITINSPSPEHPFAEIVLLEQADSTNKYAREWLKNNEFIRPVAVITHNQTHGQGQAGNSWESLPGLNITGSVILSPTFLEPSRQFLLNMIASLSIAGMLETFLPSEQIRIKWPNDVFVGDRKIAGILIHNTIIGERLDKCICGMGVNINQAAFSKAAPMAVSLKMLTGNTYDCNELLLSLLSWLEHYYRLAEGGKRELISSSWHSRLYRRFQPSPFRHNNNRITAEIEGVDDFGRLVLKGPDGQLVCDMKEIEYLF